MGSALARDRSDVPQVRLGRARLYVAWQDPTSRAIEPVGRLDRNGSDGDAAYEFRYLNRAAAIRGFQPFLSFPDLHRTYRSTHLFPLFENRLMPRRRPDYRGFVQALGLSENADPFEILARSEGRRQTDRIEVFPEPEFDGHTAQCLFLVHGIRHLSGAEDAISSLEIGERLFVIPDPQNPVDRCAVALRDECSLLGWVPRYLTELIRRPLQEGGASAVTVQVEHVGARSDPIHLRLLCQLRVRWPETLTWMFHNSDFEVIDQHSF